MISESTVMEYSGGTVSKEIEKIWSQIERLVKIQPEERLDFSEETAAIPISLKRRRYERERKM